MSHRFLTFIVVLAVAILPAAGQSAKSSPAAGKNWTAPRTADGTPDLQGTWTNATSTPLERAKGLGAKTFYTEAELAEIEKRTAERLADRVHYDYSQFGLGRTQSVRNEGLRTSLIVGPEGRIPAMTPEAQKRVAERVARVKGHEFDGPETRPLAERCIILPHEGPPMLPPTYNANLQIVQGPEYVTILQEEIHDLRVIPTDGRPHLPSNIRQWMGDSRGHWEGDTLVVDTINFTDRTAFRNSTQNLHVVERFTRVNADTIKYEFTVSDPSTWEQSWSAEIPMTKTNTPIYEYACHEANYGFANTLSGARSDERKAAAGSN